MLTREMTDRLEKIQRDVYKTIFGVHLSYRTILKENDLFLLASRCQEMFDNFARKASTTPRFSSRWFLTRIFTHHDLRKEKKINYEGQSRTSRLYNSPLYSMRRRLNEIALPKLILRLLNFYKKKYNANHNRYVQLLLLPF